MESAGEAVFPCILRIDCCFNKTDPIHLWVTVVLGTMKVGTPICIPSKDFISIGRIASIKNHGSPVDYVTEEGYGVIEIIGDNPEEQQKIFGWDFDETNELVSRITKESVAALIANHREEFNCGQFRRVVQMVMTELKL